MYTKLLNIFNYYILFLLLMVMPLEAFLKWEKGDGSREILKDDVESNVTKTDTKWIVQRLDNFDDEEKRTWKMKYLENLDHFQENGPIYLQIGGENAISDEIGKWTSYKLASETRGAFIMSEHRYYGDSMPLNNSVTENLKYLSSEQALADLAHLIKSIKLQPKFKHSKVIAVGGSYPGNLAAWMRATYPDIVDCAWASSAPVLAKKDAVEYLEQVGEDFLKYGSEQCYEKITQIFNRYHNLLQTAEGIKQLKKEQNICKETDMTNSLNKAFFFASKTSRFRGIAQYLTPFDIKKLCNNMTIISRDKLVHLINVLNIENESKKEYHCNNFEFIKQCYTGSDYRSWIYQQCTEFGHFPTTNSNNQPFSKDLILDYYTKTCSVCFGEDFNESKVDKAVSYTNKRYGGLSPNVTKVIFLHGTVDPWHRLGVTKSLSDDVPAVMIEGTSHCKDVYSYKPSEPKQLTEAREYAKKMIKYWLGLGPRPAPYNDYCC